MARATRDARLETRTARLKLSRGRRYQTTLTGLMALCYRRTKAGFGTWYARLTDPQGKERVTKLGAADDHAEADGRTVLTYAQAQEKCRALAKETHATKGAPLTVAEAAERYLAWYKEHRRAYQETDHTVQAHVLPTFGERLVSDLRTVEIKVWLNRLATQPARIRTVAGKKQRHRDKPSTPDQKRARKSTANRVLTVLKAILNRAFEDELVSEDTAWRRVRPFENADEPVTRFLTETEAKRLINVCGPDFRRLVKAALFTGTRYSELAGMTAANFNADSASVYIEPSKSGRGRHVPLNAQGLAFFKECAAGRTGKDLLFTKADGSAWKKNHHVRSLQNACKVAKITPAIGFHELRHTYASLLAQAGADLLTISKLLGHADTRITSRHYAHLCDRTLSNAVRTLLPGFGHESDSKITAIR